MSRTRAKPEFVASPDIVDFAGAGPHFVTAAHDGKIVRVTHGAACTLRLPQTATATIALPFMCGVVQGGAGQLTVDKEGADVIESPGALTKLVGQHYSAVINKRVAGAPNTWLLTGDLA